MVRPNAQRHVAAMADALPGRNQAVVEFPGHPVGIQMMLPTVATERKLSVARAAEHTCLPQPAPLALRDLRPKARHRSNIHQALAVRQGYLWL
jgi:hypothetical protein